jgi:hypothetical protein
VKGTAIRIAAPGGMTLVSMLIVESFIGALHQPAPHHLPPAVVGRAGVTGRLSAALSQQVPGAFDLKPYGTDHAAREAILNRHMDPARVPGPARQRLLMAGAAGRFVTGAVTATLRAEAAGQRDRFHSEEPP